MSLEIWSGVRGEAGHHRHALPSPDGPHGTHTGCVHGRRTWGSCVLSATTPGAGWGADHKPSTQHRRERTADTVGGNSRTRGESCPGYREELNHRGYMGYRIISKPQRLDLSNPNKTMPTNMQQIYKAKPGLQTGNVQHTAQSSGRARPRGQ